MTNVVRKLRTVDAPVRMSRAAAIDTVLNVATEAELAAYFGGRAKNDLGRVWDGIFKPMLDALDSATRDEVLSKLDDYQAPSEAFRIDSLGTLASKGTNDSVANATLRQWRDSTGRQLESINRQNAKFWEERLRS